MSDFLAASLHTDRHVQLPPEDGQDKQSALFVRKDKLSADTQTAGFTTVPEHHDDVRGAERWQQAVVAAAAVTSVSWCFVNIMSNVQN